MPLIETKGAASAQGFGLTLQQAAANYIEDVFSTWLYTGNSTTGGNQTITNGVNLSANGGMVWIKGRSAAADNVLFDTVRGVGTNGAGNRALSSNLTAAQNLATSYDYLSQFNTNGFRVTQAGATTASRATNYSGVTYASWTFRKQPKFFDVVTYTGNGANRTIAHNLGSVPGCIIVKRIDIAADWQVYHRSLANTEYLVLNSSAAKATGTTRWNSTTPTSTVFSVGTDTTVNANGNSYVAYLFAHDAGGFGLTGTDNVISCGSFTTDGSGNATINLGYEPQFLLFKSTNNAADWRVVDNMRGFPNVSTLSGIKTLSPNTSQIETAWSGGGAFGPTSTGFQFYAGFGGPAASNSNIYIAIRRGPMKTPTSASTVFNVSTRTGDGLSYTVTNSNFAPDMYLAGDLQATTNGGLGQTTTQRLVGPNYLLTNSTAAEGTNSFWQTTDWGIRSITAGAGLSTSGYPYVDYLFGRAPGFFDVVCYTGDGVVGRSVAHNLGVTPELVIIKQRSGVSNWIAGQGASFGASQLYLDAAVSRSSTTLNMSLQTSTNIVVGASGLVSGVNTSGQTYVAYLFASCPGVSKVGTYSGTGATQTISCGFAARFVMIKRTDGSPPGSTNGNWWVWDTARGMVAGNDTRFALNSKADYLNANWVYTNASGFQIVTTDATVNASGGTYIYFAIA